MRETPPAKPGRRMAAWAWAERFAAAVWLVAAAWAFSDAMWRPIWALVVLAGFALAAASIVRLTALVLCERLGRPAPKGGWGLAVVLWLITPMIGLAGFGFAVTDLDFKVRFYLSRPAFDRAQAAGLTRADCPTWIGLFRVTDITTEPGPLASTRYETVPPLLIGMGAGVLHAPGGPPEPWVDSVSSERTERAPGGAPWFQWWDAGD